MNDINVLYIHSHDTGRIIEPYGYPVPTPNLMKLAGESAMFGSMFCANPTCSPSRAALLTGQYPHSCGQFGLAHRGFRMPSFTHHIVRYLSGQGYTTALSGIQHVAHGEDAPSEIGYQEYLGSREAAERQAADWLLSKPSGPFFLSCGFFETHRVFPELQPEEREEQVNGPGAVSAPGYADSEPLREDFARYRKSAAVLDRKIGVVLDALERSGLDKTTIVLCTTDHGIAFPEMKCSLKDGGIGVMCFLKIPGRDPVRIDALTSQVDLVPTLCELLDIPKPDWLQGRSLVPLIDGSAESVRDEVFAEVNFHAAPEPKRAVRSDRYKLIRRYDNRTKPVLPNVDDSLSKEAFLASGWADGPLASEQLYDLFLDPYERCNRISDASLAAVRDDLRARLDGWMEDTDDPLLNGPLEPPSGAKVNRPDGASPTDPPQVAP
jgi:arylsulfatase A-like enzyme